MACSRKDLIVATVLTALAVPMHQVPAAETQPAPMDHSPGYTITAYYWPNYHVDARNEQWFGPGWTEWEITKYARPRFEGHNQPRVPLWGYEDESDPAVMARKIDAAAQHGVDVLIFDWYYYNDGSFLRSALDKGYLAAPNNHQVRFALMWANHDMPDVFPAKLQYCYPNWKILIPGQVTRETFEQMTDEIIGKYFKHPSYWLIDGSPYFSIYDLDTLVQGLGGIANTKEALDGFRARTKAAGFPDLHLNVVLRGERILGGGAFVLDVSTGQEREYSQDEIGPALGFRSLGAYTWAHNVNFPTFPTSSYQHVREESVRHWRRTAAAFRLPYYGNVTCGWDSTPRMSHTDIYVRRGYPFLPTLVGNTPDEFKQALVEMKRWLDEGGNPDKVFSINSWNEWPEGSYLEPDTTHKYGYLEAIRDVFGGSR
jgi:hypothetical protein